MVRVDSYARFSSPQQKLGDSERRQIDAAKAYCLENDLTLNESILDEGMSGYHAAHRTKGALGRYIARVMAGDIEKGSILIIEDLDRLSREVTSEAQELFLFLVNRGIEIVDLGNDRKFTKRSVNANPGELFLTLGQMMGNYNQSAKKADRIRESWIKRRIPGSVTNTVPSWIRKVPAVGNDPAHLAVDEAKKGHVLYMGELALIMGADKIAARMNDEKIPCLRGRPLSRSAGVWDQGVVLKILRSRTLLGEQAIGHYQDQKRVMTGEFQKNAYPSIMSELQWLAIQQALDSRRRGSGNALAGGRNATKITNLFGSLARCGACGNRMIVVQKGRGSSHYLRCSLAKLGQCAAKKYHRLNKVEPLFLSIFGEAVLSSVEAPKDDLAMALQAELDGVRVQVARLASIYETMFMRSGEEAPDSLASKTLVKIANEHKVGLANIKYLEGKIFAIRAAKPPHEQFNLIRDHIRSLLLPPGTHAITGSGKSIKPLTVDEQIMTRARIAASLPLVIKTMTFHPSGTYTVEIVDTLPATLPTTQAGNLVRLWHQDGNRFTLNSSGEITDRRVRHPSQVKGSGTFSRPLPKAA